MDEKEGHQDNDFSIHRVGRFISKEVADWLESCCLEIQLKVGVYVVAEAMHYLPLIVSEASQSETVLENICFMVDKVMPYANHRNQQQRADSSKYIGKV